MQAGIGIQLQATGRQAVLKRMMCTTRNNALLKRTCSSNSSTACYAPRGTSRGLWRSGKGPHRPWPPSQRCWQPAHPAARQTSMSASSTLNLTTTPRHAVKRWWHCAAGSGTSCTCLHQGQQALRGRHLVQLRQQVWQHLQCRNVLPLFVLPATMAHTPSDIQMQGTGHMAHSY
jgi:hypothetical protein